MNKQKAAQRFNLQDEFRPATTINSSYLKEPLTFGDTSVVRLLYAISVKHCMTELSALRRDIRTSAALR